MLKSDLCDFSDVYIVLIFLSLIQRTQKKQKQKNKSVAFKNNASFNNCISKIHGVQIGNADDQDDVMSMYNLLEYSKNYRKTTWTK